MPGSRAVRASRCGARLPTKSARESGRGLPPEVALAQRFGVNRHTVRAAISGLVQEGILEAVQGRGTFVVPARRMTYRIDRRTRFSASLDGQTDQRRITMIEAATEPVSAEIAANLGMTAGEAGIRVETLGVADAMPVSRATSWFDAERFSGIAVRIEALGSVTAALQGFGIADYYRRTTRIEARHASDADRRYLDLAPGAIVIVASSVNVDTDGRITHISRTRFAADRVDLFIDTPCP